MKGKKALFLLVIILSLLTGCWSRTEVNDVAIVIGIALDKGENEKLQLGLQIAIPKGLGTSESGGQGSGTSKSTMMISAEGENIMEVFRTIQKKLPRDVFFAHNRVIIVGEELARDGVLPILDFFSRYRESSLSSYILFTKGRASEILNSTPRLESIMAEEIREQEKRGVGIEIQVRDFLKVMLADGEEAVAVQISNLPLETRNENETEEAASSKRAPALNGAAVFQGDQLIGWLNDKEARGILWLRNELKSGTMTVTIQEEKGGGKVGAQILKGSTKTKPIISKDKVKIKIEAYGEVEIFENSSTLDLSDPEVINNVKLMFEKDVRKRIQLTLDKAQKELKSDIFGFGQAVYRTDPKKWEQTYKKKWPEVFPELEVEVVSNITIKGTGFSTKSMSLPDTKE